MSMVKQIAIAVVATIILAVVGVGSYMISKQVIPDPTNTSTNNQNNNNGNTGAGGTITVKTVETLTPKNLVMKKEGNDVVIQFDTEDKTGAVIYLSPDKSELIQQVVKDWGNGVNVKGTFYNITSEEQASTAHSIKISNQAGTIKTDEYFFYIILLYQKSRIPYGGTQDAKNGPSQPYTLKF